LDYFATRKQKVAVASFFLARLGGTPLQVVIWSVTVFKTVLKQKESILQSTLGAKSAPTFFTAVKCSSNYPSTRSKGRNKGRLNSVLYGDIKMCRTTQDEKYHQDIGHHQKKPSVP